MFMGEEIFFKPVPNFSGMSGYSAFGVDGRVDEPQVARLMGYWAAADIDILTEILESSHVSQGTSMVEFTVSTCWTLRSI